MGHRTFRPTPNVRNPQMLEEAEVFSRYLTAFKTSLTRYHTQLDSEAAGPAGRGCLAGRMGGEGGQSQRGAGR